MKVTIYSLFGKILDEFEILNETIILYNKVCSFKKKSGSYYTTSFPFIVENSPTIVDEGFSRRRSFTIKLYSYNGEIVKEIPETFYYSSNHDIITIYCKTSQGVKSIETTLPMIIEDEKYE